MFHRAEHCIEQSTEQSTALSAMMPVPRVNFTSVCSQPLRGSLPPSVPVQLLITSSTDFLVPLLTTMETAVARMYTAQI
jgi:hypothetical protein